MAASNAVIIYDIATQQPRRIVIPDSDAQITASNGPCHLNAGEAALLIPKAIYQAYTSDTQILSAIVSAAGIGL